MYLCHEDEGFIVDDLVGAERFEVGGEKLVDHVKGLGYLYGG